MKLISMLPALAGLVVLAGCDTPTPSVLSLQPVATDQEAGIDAGLIGAWDAGGSDDEVCVIRRNSDKDGDHGYRITHLGGDSQMAFEASLFSVGDARFLDLAPANDDDFHLGGHAVVRIWPEGGGLRWAFLDSDWFKQQAASALANHTSEKKMLLLAPGPTVRSFIAKYGADDWAYGKVATWQRVQ